MIRRLFDMLAPVRPPGEEAGYRRLLRWAALPVTDRRWAAPLAAVALGFGLFAGVAIGPGTTGTLATGTPQVIEIPSLLAGGPEEEEEAESAGAEGETFGESTAEGGGGESAALPAEPGFSEPEPAFEEEEESKESTGPMQEPAESTPEDEGSAAPEAEPVSGVVVHANPAAGSYTIVAAGGLLEAIHAPKLPPAGSRITVPTKLLANGTLAEAGKRKLTGSRLQATLSGTVTFVDADPAAPAYAVSKRGVSLLIHVHPDPTGAVPLLPQLGAYATVGVEIEKPQPGAAVPPPVETAPVAEAPACAPDPAKPPTIPAPTGILWQSRLEADGAPFASSDFEGVVMAVCPSEGALLLSADDLRESGKDILLTVPKSIDTAKLKPGDSVAATAAIEAGGALKLTGLASDERTKGADDAGAAQGDLASHAPK